MFVNMTAEALAQRNNDWQSEFARYKASAECTNQALAAQAADGVRAQKNETALIPENLRLNALAKASSEAERGHGAAELHNLRIHFHQCEVRMHGECNYAEGRCNDLAKANERGEMQLKKLYGRLELQDAQHREKLSSSVLQNNRAYNDLSAHAEALETNSRKAKEYYVLDVKRCQDEAIQLVIGGQKNPVRRWKR